MCNKTQNGEYPPVLTSILILYGGEFLSGEVTKFDGGIFTYKLHEKGISYNTWQLTWKLLDKLRGMCYYGNRKEVLKWYYTKNK